MATAPLLTECVTVTILFHIDNLDHEVLHIDLEIKLFDLNMQSCVQKAID